MGVLNDGISGTLAVDHGGIAESEAITTFGDVDMTGKPLSTNIAWRIYRLGSTDSFAGTARLIEFDIHYQLDSGGSRQEFIKD